MKMREYNEVKEIVKEIYSARVNQLEAHDHLIKNEDLYVGDQLLNAALVYIGDSVRHWTLDIHSPEWPWNLDSYNPRNPRCNLIRAAAFIVAEIERLDRVEKYRAAAENFKTEENSAVYKATTKYEYPRVPYNNLGAWKPIEECPRKLDTPYNIRFVDGAVTTAVYADGEWWTNNGAKCFIVFNHGITHYADIPSFEENKDESKPRFTKLAYY